jgi:hypothetical protein
MMAHPQPANSGAANTNYTLVSTNFVLHNVFLQQGMEITPENGSWVPLPAYLYIYL